MGFGFRCEGLGLRVCGTSRITVGDDFCMRMSGDSVQLVCSSLYLNINCFVFIDVRYLLVFCILVWCSTNDFVNGSLKMEDGKWKMNKG